MEEGLRALGAVSTPVASWQEGKEGFEGAGGCICRWEAQTGARAGMLSPETRSFPESICSGSGFGVLVSICTSKYSLQTQCRGIPAGV